MAIIGIAGSLASSVEFIDWVNDIKYKGGHWPITKLALTSVVLVPVICFILCGIFGGLLALMERWSYKVGFLYVAGNLAGLANPLTDGVPTTGPCVTTLH